MSLRETQCAIADWIRAPEGVEKALRDAAGEKSDLTASNLQALVQSDARLGAASRLEIYANAYFYRILGVLEDDYQALSALLGKSLFNDLVTSYLIVEPSRHASLRYAGRRLPAFLASHPAAEGILERTPWAAELAAFEWARVDVFDAEDREVLTRAKLASVAPEAFAELAMQTGSWLRKATFEHPVDLLWRAGMEGGERPAESVFAAAAADFLVWRIAERVRHRRLEPLESDALSFVAEGATFAALCEWTAERMDEATAPALAAGWLERWLADELLLAVDL